MQNMMQKIDASAVRSKNNTLKEYFVSFYEVPTTLRYALLVFASCPTPPVAPADRFVPARSPQRA